MKRIGNRIAKENPRNSRIVAFIPLGGATAAMTSMAAVTTANASCPSALSLNAKTGVAARRIVRRRKAIDKKLCPARSSEKLVSESSKVANYRTGKTPCQTLSDQVEIRDVT